METTKKITYQVLKQAANLVNNGGDVYAWNSEYDKNTPPKARRFASVQDAKEYEELQNVILSECKAPKLVLIIGTEKDYQKAVKEWQVHKNKEEKMEYAQYAEGMITADLCKIQALDALSAVCRDFDGKVINRRFCDAVRAISEYSCTFDSLGLQMCYVGRERLKGVDFRIFGSREHMEDSDAAPCWQWFTNDRMEAAKALQIIENEKKQRLNNIERIKSTVSQYSAYLRKVRKLQDEVRQLADSTDILLRDYVKSHNLRYSASDTVLK